jgi:hypothetical protein
VGGVIGVSGKAVAIFRTLEVLNVRRDRIEREVIKAFIKAGMFGDFDLMGFGIIPKDILDSVG